jgi:hypothetical protein
MAKLQLFSATQRIQPVIANARFNVMQQSTSEYFGVGVSAQKCAVFHELLQHKYPQPLFVLHFGIFLNSPHHRAPARAQTWMGSVRLFLFGDENATMDRDLFTSSFGDVSRDSYGYSGGEPGNWGARARIDSHRSEERNNSSARNGDRGIGDRSKRGGRRHNDSKASGSHWRNDSDPNSNDDDADVGSIRMGHLQSQSSSQSHSHSPSPSHSQRPPPPFALVIDGPALSIALQPAHAARFLAVLRCVLERVRDARGKNIARIFPIHNISFGVQNRAIFFTDFLREVARTHYLNRSIFSTPHCLTAVCHIFDGPSLSSERPCRSFAAAARRCKRYLLAFQHLRFSDLRILGVWCAPVNAAC